MKVFLENSRYIVLFGVAGTLLASLSLFVFGLVGVIAAVWHFVHTQTPLEYDNLKLLSVHLIQVIDIFLLATVLYIIALGLYELFIDDRLNLPHWLEVHTLDDLKARLLGVVVVLLPVTFFGQLVEWKQGPGILWAGLAVGWVLIAVAATQFVVKTKSPRPTKTDPS